MRLQCSIDCMYVVQVYMFGHRNAAASLPVIELSVRQAAGGPEAKLYLSARHFIPVAANATAAAVNTYAQNVQPGDVLTTVVNGMPSASTVIAKRTAVEQGAFNPYTKVGGCEHNRCASGYSGCSEALLETVYGYLTSTCSHPYRTCTNMSTSAPCTTLLAMEWCRLAASQLNYQRRCVCRRVARSSWTVCWRPATVTGFWTTQCSALRPISLTCFPLHTRSVHVFILASYNSC